MSVMCEWIVGNMMCGKETGLFLLGTEESRTYEPMPVCKEHVYSYVSFYGKSVVNVDVEDASMLKVSQVSNLLGVSEGLVWKLVRTGDLPSYKIAGSRRIDKQEVDKYLERTRSQSSA